MKVKSIYFINLEEIIYKSNQKCIKFIAEFNTNNKKDLTNLFLHYFIYHILEIHSNNKNLLIILYMNQDIMNNLIINNDLINYKKFIRLITKTIKFPLVISTIDYITFFNLLNSDCAEYDEIVNNYIFLTDLFPKLVKYVKSLNFTKIENDFIIDLKRKMQTLITFSY